MKEIVLGTRLQAIADYVPQGARIADIGTDHGYLPIYLIQARVVKEAIGIDVHEGPYQSALGTVKSYGFASSIQVRFGDGLNPLKEGEADTLILAGMGGNTMLEIFEARPEILRDIKQIIVQPQGSLAKLRREMLIQSWLIQDEKMVLDEGRLYMIINLTKDEGKTLKDINNLFERILKRLNLEANSESTYNTLWSLGPCLLEKKEPLLIPYIEDLINELDQRIEQMKRSQRLEVQAERAELKNEKSLLEGIKQWLFQLD